MTATPHRDRLERFRAARTPRCPTCDDHRQIPDLTLAEVEKLLDSARTRLGASICRITALSTELATEEANRELQYMHAENLMEQLARMREQGE